MSWYRLAKKYIISSIDIRPVERLPDQGLPDLFALSYKVRNDFYHDIVSKMGEFEKAHFDNGYFDITTDGDWDWKSNNGTINFYLGGIIPAKRDEYINHVGELLKANGGTILEDVKIDKSGVYDSDVARFVIDFDPTPPEDVPQLNWANGNAERILQDILGYNVSIWDIGEIDATELLQNIKNAKQQWIGGFPTERNKNVINIGLSAPQIVDKLNQLEHIANWSLFKGDKKVHFV